jgi:hypothetical protein
MAQRVSASRKKGALRKEPRLLSKKLLGTGSGRRKKP